MINNAVEDYDQAIKLIDPTRKIQVYKNLHKSCFSVKQGGVVKFHTRQIMLNRVKFNVSEAGREKVRREKRKNVHATISGYINDQILDICTQYSYEIEYNPYKYDRFYCMDIEEYVDAADYVVLETWPKAIHSVFPEIIGYGLAN